MELPVDSNEFVGLFAASGVEFLVVGGHAVAFHGHPRFTQDLDLLVRPSVENGRRVVEALKRFGFGSLDVKAEEFASPDLIIQLGRAPHRIDLITGLSGVTFDEAWATRVEARIRGSSVFMISREALIKNKRATGRTQDLADAERLEARPTNGGEDPPR